MTTLLDTTTPRQALETCLENPATAAALVRLLERIDSLEELLSGAETALGRASPALGTITDSFDEAVRRAATDGVDVDARLRGALELLVRLSEPRTVRALGSLVDRVDRLESLFELADSLPGLVGTAVDSLDELYRRTSGTRESYAAVQTELSALARSDVLSPSAVQMVGKAGRALAQSYEADLRQPAKIGFGGLLRALFDPRIRRSLGYLVSFGRRFGELLDAREPDGARPRSPESEVAP